MEQNESDVLSKSAPASISTTRDDTAGSEIQRIILFELSRNKYSLNLSNKNIEEIPKEVFNITTLTQLDLSHNLLSNLPSDIKNLSNLQKLDLSSNKLTALPNELGNHIAPQFSSLSGHLTKLQELVLSDNPLPKQIKLDHFRGVLLSNLRESVTQDSVYVNSPKPIQAKRSNTLAVIRRPISNKPALIHSISSYAFTSKSQKYKYTKEIRDKKNEWKKKIQFLEIGAEHRKNRDRAVSVETVNYARDQMRSSLRLSDSNLPTFLKKPRDDKWLLQSKAYKGSYNMSFPCTVRTVYLKKDEKVDFYHNVVAGSEMNHPNVCQIIAVVKYKKKKAAFEYEPEALSQGHAPILIVTEAIPQGTLQDWLQSSNSEVSNLKKLVSIAKQIAQGMQQLHECKPPIIHHNLKTSNVLFTQSWTAKITDFYLGNRVLKEFRGTECAVPLRSSKSDDLTKEEKEDPTFKCPFWIAPELWKHQPYDEKIDVYSFGFLLWELLTKQTPFINIKNIETLVQCLCDEQIRPGIPDSVPNGLKDLISMCWDQDPGLRPTFKQIVSSFDDLLVESLIEDKIGRKLWKREFAGQPSMCWSDFIFGFNDYFKLNIKTEHLDSIKSLHDLLVDSDDVVTIENFSKMTQWFGPMDSNGYTIIDTIHQLQSKSWFHGNLSSIQAEDMLSEKAKGTFLVRFSSSHPGSYAISVNTEESVKHYKIWHKPGGIYTLGKEKEYKTLDDLIADRQDQLNLRFACPKGERYSDSNFWVTSEMDENETKTVVSLKKLCFRFIYRNQHLFPALKDVIPLELTDEFRRTLVDSITSDELGRELWKSNFLGKESISFEQFAFAFFDYLHLPIEPFSFNYKILYALTKDIADNGDDSVTIENFSKLLEWFGPMSPLIMEKIREIVTKEWFHGNLTHLQAERLIQKSSNAKKGAFLIRFSSKNRGYFTVTVVGRKRSLLHYRVYYNRAKQEYVMGKRVFKSLEEILRTYHRELCLRTPCPGSKFQMFQISLPEV